MCRIAAYVGTPLPLSQLLYDPPHSLENQSYRPREMVSGTVNVDGTGVVWWADDDAAPLRYVSPLPPWSDPNLPTLATRLCGSPILATVRSATPGMPAGAGAVLPFVHGDLAGSHNGYLAGFREGVVGACVAQLDAETLGSIHTLTDSAVLFGLAVDHWRREARLEAAAAHAVSTADEICARVGTAASLNLVLASAASVVAVRYAREVESNSLYVRRDDAGAWLASEPLDDGDWSPVPDRHVVRLDAGGTYLAPFDALAASAKAGS